MDSFYRAFEDRYRGSRKLIKSRLTNYSPFFEPLAARYPGGKTFDLGCGRGEWLELMAEAGFEPMGVDLDADMLEACRERGLPVQQGDAIAYLASLESDSHALISAFHVVEHVSFEQLGVIVREALRVLKPGGLLILETPNPENISVATTNFYMDPSHQKPIPPLLLSFVAEHAGFDRVKVVRLQESPELRDAATPVQFLDIVRGASPDYAIVAQKDVESTEGAFDEAFGAEYGLTIDTLIQRYETRLTSNVSQIGGRVQQMGARLQSIEGQLRLAEGRLQLAEDRSRFAEEQRVLAEQVLREVEARAQHAEELARLASSRVVDTQLLHVEDRCRQLEAQLALAESKLHEAEARAQHEQAVARQTHAHLQAVYRSTSWRVTAPLRWVSLGLRGKGLGPLKRTVKKQVKRVVRYAYRQPVLRRLTVAVLNRVPGLKARLVPYVAAAAASQPVGTASTHIRIDNLDAHANRIHASLVAEFDRLKQEKN
ncbi:methyltransferase domain-containing protein [Burkholderia anthina]|uniref:class I SAM-dependent methyltransferase n=1 Tax=Burkholderia anthina TaxID=179879 RepID=UPI001CF100B8|nr:class I SAM-dependent methyltransferase [Burkholderia anthina]MCA8093244.1 methyltransferase domain-containing protein [Burkholderia anthina]